VLQSVRIMCRTVLIAGARLFKR